MRALLIGLVCVLGLPAAGWAQSASGGLEPVAGSDVRITTNADRPPLRGILIGIEDAGLRISVGGSPLLVPRSEIVQVEVKTGRRGHAGAGAVFGALLGLLGSQIEPRHSGSGGLCGPSEPCSRTASAGIQLLRGALGGALVGMFIRTDVWSPARLDVGVMVGPSRGAAGRGVAIGGVLRF